KSLLDATTFPNPSTALGTAITTDQGVVFDGPRTTAAGGPAHLFTPPTWSASSFSHMDQRSVLGAPSSGTNYYPDGNANGLMRPVVPQGQVYHDPGPIMLGMFQDMGWQLNIPATTVSESPSPVAAGASLTATWAGIGAPSTGNWIGVYPSSGTASTSYTTYKYLNGASSGSTSIPLPSNAAPGTTYELRLFASSSYSVLATSAPFTV